MEEDGGREADLPVGQAAEFVHAIDPQSSLLHLVSLLLITHG